MLWSPIKVKNQVRCTCQEEYVLEACALNFSVQGLSDALTAPDTKVTVVQPPSEEYALLLGSHHG